MADLRTRDLRDSERGLFISAIERLNDDMKALEAKLVEVSTIERDRSDLLRKELNDRLDSLRVYYDARLEAVRKSVAESYEERVQQMVEKTKGDIAAIDKAVAVESTRTRTWSIILAAIGSAIISSLVPLLLHLTR